MKSFEAISEIYKEKVKHSRLLTTEYCQNHSSQSIRKFQKLVKMYAGKKR